jgi:hypothetical protein
MRQAWLLAVLALAACATRGAGRDGVYTVRGFAGPFSLNCSQQAVTQLGYQVVWFDGGDGLRAERRLDEAGPETTRGYLTVSFSSESYGEMMYVSAERLRQSSRLPLPANPRPGPQPQPQPVPFPSARRSGSDRVSPGEVAEDARRVAQRCATGAVTNVD